MTVLVTGGTGFVGSWVVRNLLERGNRAVIYDLYVRNDAIEDFAGRVKVVRGDLLDLGFLVETMKSEGVDRVVHTASYLSYESQVRPPMAVKINCEGTANVLEASRLTDVRRVVFTSTQAVYGTTPPGHAVDEDLPPNPTTVYGATKRMCEWLGLNYFSIYGLDFIAVRFPTLYGPSKTGRGWSVAITDLVENPVLGKPAEIASGGDVKQDWLHVADAARTVVNACFVEDPEHRIYNLGSNESHTLIEIAEIVRRHIPDAVIEISTGPEPVYGLGAPFDSSRARSELGHEVTLSLEEGIAEWIDAVRTRARIDSG